MHPCTVSGTCWIQIELEVRFPWTRVALFLMMQSLHFVFRATGSQTPLLARAQSLFFWQQLCGRLQRCVALCLMPNHGHLIVRQDDGVKAQKSIRLSLLAFKRHYSKSARSPGFARTTASLRSIQSRNHLPHSLFKPNHSSSADNGVSDIIFIN